MSSPRMYARRKAAKHDKRQAIIFLGAGMALGLAIGWMLDPRRRGRHKQAVQHATATMRHEAHDAATMAHRAANVAHGTVAHATSPVREVFKEPLDDTTLAHKVETEIFRPAGAPKGAVDVNAENGVVYLRGQVDSAETIAELVKAAERVHGVRAVQSLLHLPGTPAPSREDVRS